MKNKFWYIAMKIGIFIAYVYCLALSVIYKSFYSRKRNKNLAIYLHSPKYSDGYYRRFLMFHDCFKNSGIDYKIFSLIKESEFQKIQLSDDYSLKYKLYLKISFKRATQIALSVRYKNIFVQRVLFPFYPEYSSLFFERILSFLGGNRILDIWDPVHVWHPKLTYNSFKFYNKLSVNTGLLKKDYSKHFDKENIIIWPIAVDFSRFTRKPKLKNDKTVLFYTGSKGNVVSYLEPIIPVIEDLANHQKIELLVIGNYAPKSNKFDIIHQKWSEENIKNAIENADLGLYPNFQKEKTKNYTVAGKSLDYMSARLPLVGADQGLAEGIEIQKAIFNAESINEWKEVLLNAINSPELAQQKADYAYDFINSHLNIELIFSILREQLLVE
jgi:hypothetical protein